MAVWLLANGHMFMWSNLCLKYGAKQRREFGFTDWARSEAGMKSSLYLLYSLYLMTYLIWSSGLSADDSVCLRSRRWDMLFLQEVSCWHIRTTTLFRSFPINWSCYIFGKHKTERICWMFKIYQIIFRPFSIVLIFSESGGNMSTPGVRSLIRDQKQLWGWSLALWWRQSKNQQRGWPMSTVHSLWMCVYLFPLFLPPCIWH